MRSISEHALDCPYCGEPVTVLIDHSAGEQEYVEDCEVCCRPLVIHVLIESNGEAAVSARYENE